MDVSAFFGNDFGFSLVFTMSATHYQQQFDILVQRASEILQTPGKAVTLDAVVEENLLKFARLERRTGLAGGMPVIGIQGHGRGHSVVAGLEVYRLAIGGTTVRFVKVYDQLMGRVVRPIQDFCVVPAEHYVRFYRFVREKVRRRPGNEEPAPIMAEEIKTRLWENTVGFLTRGRELLKQYGVPQKRGVLLMGEPGNGKTMACRWLRNECYRQGLAWRYVRSEVYERTRADGDLESLFDTEDPGVILFDDFDLGVRNREDCGATAHHSTFLGELDGVDAHQGVVYLFTTNARLPDLDPAFLRPGRIDHVVQFSRPEADSRRRLILEHWHADIRQAIDVDSHGGRDRRSELCGVGGAQEAAGAAVLGPRPVGLGLGLDDLQDRRPAIQAGPAGDRFCACELRRAARRCPSRS